MSDSPLGMLTAGAVMIHEFYASLQDAGFTKREAMELVKHQMSISANLPPDTTPPPNR